MPASTSRRRVRPVGAVERPDLPPASGVAEHPLGERLDRLAGPHPGKPGRHRCLHGPRRLPRRRCRCRRGDRVRARRRQRRRRHERLTPSTSTPSTRRRSSGSTRRTSRSCGRHRGRRPGGIEHRGDDRHDQRRPQHPADDQHAAAASGRSRSASADARSSRGSRPSCPSAATDAHDPSPTRLHTINNAGTPTNSTPATPPTRGQNRATAPTGVDGDAVDGCSMRWCCGLGHRTPPSWCHGPVPTPATASAEARWVTVRDDIIGNHESTVADTRTVTRLPLTRHRLQRRPRPAHEARRRRCRPRPGRRPGRRRIAAAADSDRVEGVGPGPGRLQGDRRALPFRRPRSARRRRGSRRRRRNEHREQHDERGQVAGAPLIVTDPAGRGSPQRSSTERPVKVDRRPGRARQSPGRRADVADPGRPGRSPSPLTTPPGAHADADTATAGPPAQAVPASANVAAAAAWAAACASPAERSIDAARAATAAAWVTPSAATPWRPKNTNSNTSRQRQRERRRSSPPRRRCRDGRCGARRHHGSTSRSCQPSRRGHRPCRHRHRHPRQQPGGLAGDHDDRGVGATADRHRHVIATRPSGHLGDGDRLGARRPNTRTGRPTATPGPPPRRRPGGRSARTCALTNMNTTAANSGNSTIVAAMPRSSSRRRRRCAPQRRACRAARSVAAPAVMAPGSGCCWRRLASSAR